ncbi:unnamed protein product [Amoebophrya sp. A25]|nr:unnamed protein product [Amoebophrya sp. A25]|eukprot:GSA25T00020679001.1
MIATSKGPFTSLTQFDVTNELYRSACGVVFLAKTKAHLGDIPKGTLVVLKKRPYSPAELVDKKNGDRPQQHDKLGGKGKKNLLENFSLLHEYGLLMECRGHRNVIECYGYFLEDRHLVLVIEYASKGDLNKELAMRSKGKKDFRESEIWDLFLQILNGLRFVHSKGIVHRDVKSLNVFLSKEGYCKLGDFGVSRMLESDNALLSSFYGTPLYLSPEIISGSGYTQKTDIWSLGVLLYECVAGGGRMPFSGGNLRDVTNAVLGGRYKALAHAGFQEIVRMCLQKDPVKRPNAEDLYQFVKRRMAQAKRKAASRTSGPVPEEDEQGKKQLQQLQEMNMKNEEEFGRKNGGAIANENKGSGKATGKGNYRAAQKNSQGGPPFEGEIHSGRASRPPALPRRFSSAGVRGTQWDNIRPGLGSSNGTGIPSAGNTFGSSNCFLASGGSRRRSSSTPAVVSAAQARRIRASGVGAPRPAYFPSHAAQLVHFNGGRVRTGDQNPPPAVSTERSGTGVVKNNKKRSCTSWEPRGDAAYYEDAAAEVGPEQDSEDSDNEEIDYRDLPVTSASSPTKRQRLIEGSHAVPPLHAGSNRNYFGGATASGSPRRGDRQHHQRGQSNSPGLNKKKKVTPKIGHDLPFISHPHGEREIIDPEDVNIEDEKASSALRDRLYHQVLARHHAGRQQQQILQDPRNVLQTGEEQSHNQPNYYASGSSSGSAANRTRSGTSRAQQQRRPRSLSTSRPRSRSAEHAYSGQVRLDFEGHDDRRGAYQGQDDALHQYHDDLQDDYRERELPSSYEDFAADALAPNYDLEHQRRSALRSSADAFITPERAVEPLRDAPNTKDRRYISAAFDDDAAGKPTFWGTDPERPSSNYNDSSTCAGGGPRIVRVGKNPLRGRGEQLHRRSRGASDATEVERSLSRNSRAASRGLQRSRGRPSQMEMEQLLQQQDNQAFSQHSNNMLLLEQQQEPAGLLEPSTRLHLQHPLPAAPSRRVYDRHDINSLHQQPTGGPVRRPISSSPLESARTNLVGSPEYFAKKGRAQLRDEATSERVLSGQQEMIGDPRTGMCSPKRGTSRVENLHEQDCSAPTRPSELFDHEAAHHRLWKLGDHMSPRDKRYPLPNRQLSPIWQEGQDLIDDVQWARSNFRREHALRLKESKDLSRSRSISRQHQPYQGEEQEFVLQRSRADHGSARLRSTSRSRGRSDSQTGQTRRGNKTSSTSSSRRFPTHPAILPAEMNRGRSPPTSARTMRWEQRQAERREEGKGFVEAEVVKISSKGVGVGQQRSKASTTEEENEIPLLGNGAPAADYSSSSSSAREQRLDLVFGASSSANANARRHWHLGNATAPAASVRQEVAAATASASRNGTRGRGVKIKRFDVVTQCWV